jgi:tetratricopeptide (TPR) repeat protein
LNDKPDEALEILDKQILEWEDEGELLALYAGILYEAGQVQRADTYLISALTIDPEAYTTLFSYFFGLEENTHILEIIALYK